MAAVNVAMQVIGVNCATAPRPSFLIRIIARAVARVARVSVEAVLVVLTRPCSTQRSGLRRALQIETLEANVTINAADLTEARSLATTVDRSVSDGSMVNILKSSAADEAGTGSDLVKVFESVSVTGTTAAVAESAPPAQASSPAPEDSFPAVGVVLLVVGVVLITLAVVAGVARLRKSRGSEAALPPRQIPHAAAPPSPDMYPRPPRRRPFSVPNPISLPRYMRAGAADEHDENPMFIKSKPAHRQWNQGARPPPAPLQDMYGTAWTK